MMNVQGLFQVSQNPIDRLAPMVAESTFFDSTRFMEPATKEIILGEEDILISCIDVNGRIIFANSRFYEIAEYERGDLLNKPHNIIRHPDMPKTAFKDLWNVIESGNLWVGIVKNQSKSGKYYWVKALVFPCHADKKIVGYISVRKKPSYREIQMSQEAYRKLP